MPAGRPTSYSKDTLETARKFIEDSPTFGYVVPTIAALAVVLNVSRECLYEWGRKHPEFSDILRALMSKQEAELVENGLKSVFTLLRRHTRRLDDDSSALC